MPHKSLIIIVCLSLILSSCNKEIKTSFSEINVSTESNNIVEVNIPKAIGNKGITSKINSAIQKPIIAALHVGDPDQLTSKSIKESINLFNNEYATFKTDFPEAAPQWEAQIDGEVMFQSPEIISIAITSYTNTGGAHGALNISLLNFEAKTGELIQNSELINNVEGFKKLAKTYFDEAIKDKDIIFNTETFKLPTNIAYSEEGVVLLYNTYEIAPYSTGVIEFSIPFNDAKPYLVFNSL